MSDEWDHAYVRGVQSAKRVDVVRIPWMGDWFASHSPRNGNNNAEGPWDHWVQLALSILQHPATAVVRPEVHAAVQGIENTRFYDSVGRALTNAELVQLFGADPEEDDDGAE